MARHQKHHHNSTGPSQRQLRVGESIRRALAEILSRGDHYEPELEGKLISVTEVRTSPDLRVANVYVYPHGGDDGQVLETLTRIRSHLRNEVTREIHLKFSPELRFNLDTSFDYADQTMSALDRVNREGG